MQCPLPVAEIVQEILHTGILRIRAAAWSGDTQRCAIEADHIHNLPALLKDYSDERLRYYWEVERPAFIEQSSGTAVAELERLWERLSSEVDFLDAPISTAGRS